MQVLSGKAGFNLTSAWLQSSFSSCNYYYILEFQVSVTYLVIGVFKGDYESFLLFWILLLLLRKAIGEGGLDWF